MMKMKRNDYLDFWDKYGLLIATIGDISILAVCFMKPHWIIVSLFSILLFIASIGWSISISLHYIDEVEHKSSAINFFLGSNDSSITLGLYGCTILVPMIGLNLQPETILCICLPLISVFIGLTIGAFTIPRIYLSIKGYKLNKTLTVLMSLCTIVLLLPIIIPIYYIMISFL